MKPHPPNIDNEQIDVVDENDTVLYQTAKATAHEKGLLHRCVIAEVINPKGEWLMVKQSKSKQEPGKFVSPMGGHVRAGENVEGALKREMEEELGMKNFKYKFIGKCIYNVEVIGRKENHYFIVYEVYTDQKPILSMEAESYKWFAREELKKLIQETPEIFGNAFFPIVENLYSSLL